MSAIFSVDADPDRSLLRLRLAGFFTIEDVQALAIARNDALAQMNCGANRHITLCDARGGKLSTPEVAAEFQRMLADPRHASRRLAYIADGALARLQPTRVLNRPNMRFFDDPQAALDWLLADEPSPVPSAEHRPAS